MKSLFRQFILFILSLHFCLQISAQAIFTISQEDENVIIPFQQLPVLTHYDEGLSIQEISMSLFTTNKKNITTDFYTQFTLLNITASDKQYVLETPKSGLINCWIKKSNDSIWQLLKAGSVLKLSERSLRSNRNGLVNELL